MPVAYPTDRARMRTAPPQGRRSLARLSGDQAPAVSHRPGRVAWWLGALDSAASLRLTPAWVPEFRARPPGRIGTSPNAPGWSVGSFYTWSTSLPSPEFSPGARVPPQLPEKKSWRPGFIAVASGRSSPTAGFARAMDGSGSSPPESDLATAPATPPAGVVPCPGSCTSRACPDKDGCPHPNRVRRHPQSTTVAVRRQPAGGRLESVQPIGGIDVAVVADDARD